MSLSLIGLLLISALVHSQTIDMKLQAALDSIIRAHPDAVGIMAHVEAPDKRISWSGASGHSNKKLKSPLEEDQPALIASSIKTYVSVAVLRLVEKELLSLNESVKQLLTVRTRRLFMKDGYDLNAIKVKHLLSHTSGIADYVNEDYLKFIDEDRLHRWSRNEQLELATKVGDPLGPAGVQFSYADANYLLLTEIIEDVTGSDFYVAMRELLKYEELGMNNTWFPTLEDKPKGTKDRVHQYWGEKGWDSYGIDVSCDLYGGGGIACPTKDLAVFIQNFFEGDIVENDSIRQRIFTEIPTKETEVNKYYLGISEDNYHGLKAYGHGGFWGTVMLHFPAINTSIAVYILDRDQRGLRRDVMDVLSKIIIDQQKESISEIELITETLMDYIEGTANGEPDRLRKAFHPDFNLYTVTEENKLRTRSGEKYISNVVVGKKNSREGRIISIDYEKDAAIAKAEIVIPGWKVFTDYFLLLKYEGSWKIVHKSYTWREYPKTSE